MISTGKELKHQIKRTINEFREERCPLSRVTVFFKGEEVISCASEYQVRTLCVLVHREQISLNDIRVIEYYYDEQHKEQENVMIFRRDGNFENDFKSAFFDLCSMLAFETF